jgi:propane monooxygenase reductase subunit
MGETYQVRLEPVGVEFEVDEDETVLRGAFRQGLMLMHGCKEGSAPPANPSSSTARST